jgi:GxxExxY protein
MKHENITAVILKSFYKVYNTLGSGFLEKVYQNSLLLELVHQDLSVQKQRQINVFYLGQQVGEYYADLIVNDVVIIELKAHECIIEEHENQLVNYLEATEIEVGLLLNFGPKPEFKRKVFENQRKRMLPLNAGKNLLPSA